MTIKVLFFTLILSAIAFSQKADPEKILENVKKEFDKIDDYQVEVKIKVDVEFLKMSDRKATVFYKKPDKIHIESDNFALLPKSGLNFSPFGFLDYKYTSFYQREDTIDGILTSVIKVIPIEGNADVIISTFWIDTDRNLILQVESSRKPQGTFTVDLQYLKTDDNYWLPSSMVFTFTLEPGLFPGRIPDEFNPDKNKAKSEEVKTGKVYLKYSDYKVNIGLPDSLFDENNLDK